MAVSAPIVAEKLVLEQEASYILDIDIGNTRIKWRVQGSDGRFASGGNSLHADDFLLGLNDHYPVLRAIRLACVAKKGVAERVKERVFDLWGVEPMMACTQKQLGRLIVAYSDPGRLGVDRWLAMLAAYHEENDSVCVIDCGSAVTIDHIDKDGLHLGGYIVPGISMQTESLLKGTGQIRIESEVSAEVAWGRGTEEAVRFGVLRQVVSFVESVIGELNVGDSTAIYITGGDAGVVLACLGAADQCKCRPDLVLDGLAVALPLC